MPPPPDNSGSPAGAVTRFMSVSPSWSHPSGRPSLLERNDSTEAQTGRADISRRLALGPKSGAFIAPCSPRRNHISAQIPGGLSPDKPSQIRLGMPLPEETLPSDPFDTTCIRFDCTCTGVFLSRAIEEAIKRLGCANCREGDPRLHRRQSRSSNLSQALNRISLTLK